MPGALSMLSDEEFVRWCYRTLLARDADAAGLPNFVDSLRSGTSRIDVIQAFLESAEYKSGRGYVWRFAPPGHFYSPIPAESDIAELERRGAGAASIPGVDLNEAGQLALLEQFAALYPSVPFTDEGRPGYRYRYVNPSYAYSDAIFLHSMLRHVRPRRLIEIGSGYSSAVTLDTSEHFLGGSLQCAFVEPFPELLLGLMTPTDHGRVRVIAKRLQDVELELFDELGAGDVLFVDSTHVSKVMSDVNRIFFEILPRLKPGTFVHIHDVFYPFEYPLDWLREGRAWNEQYLLRAFLQFNGSFKIRLFGQVHGPTARCLVSRAHAAVHEESGRRDLARAHRVMRGRGRTGSAVDGRRPAPRRSS